VREGSLKSGLSEFRAGSATSYYFAPDQVSFLQIGTLPGRRAGGQDDVSSTQTPSNEGKQNDRSPEGPEGPPGAAKIPRSQSQRFKRSFCKKEVRTPKAKPNWGKHDRFEVLNVFFWTVFVRISRFPGRKWRPMIEIF